MRLTPRTPPSHKHLSNRLLQATVGLVTRWAAGPREPRVAGVGRESTMEAPAAGSTLVALTKRTAAQHLILMREKKKNATLRQLAGGWAQNGRAEGMAGCAERSADASASTPRMWAWRWRRRWFFKGGKIRTREQYDVEELRRKVAARGSPKTVFLVLKTGPRNGAGQRPPFGILL